MKKLKAQKDENRRLKKLPAERDLEVEVMKEVVVSTTQHAPTARLGFKPPPKPGMNLSKKKLPETHFLNGPQKRGRPSTRTKLSTGKRSY